MLRLNSLPWRRLFAGTGHWPGATSHAGLAPNLVRPTLSPGLVYGILSLFVNATSLGLGVGEGIEEHQAGLGVVLAKGVFLLLASGTFLYLATVYGLRHSAKIRSYSTKKGLTVSFGLALTALARVFLDKAHTEIRL